MATFDWPFRTHLFWSCFDKYTHKGLQNICPWTYFGYYRPQRSCGKVMFLHMSVILYTGGCLPDTSPRQIPLGRHPQRHPPGQTPLRQTPPGQKPPKRWPLQQMVRILLECILAFEICHFITIPGPFGCFSEKGCSQEIKVYSILGRC